MSHASAVIGVTVSVTTLAGLDDAPGESFGGQFVLSADLVRELAGEPGTLFYRIFTDQLGHVLDVTETGRYPSRKLRTALEIRDGVCQFPTCSRPASESDIDHDIPHPRGPTAGSNLGPLCRRHHRMKSHGIFTTELTSVLPGKRRPRDGQPQRAFHLVDPEEVAGEHVVRSSRPLHAPASPKVLASQIEYAFTHRLAKGA
ncbi:hypothetical protein BH09ACT10_BH09ACT10_12770 [soil metagenome]